MNAVCIRKVVRIWEALGIRKVVRIWEILSIREVVRIWEVLPIRKVLCIREVVRIRKVICIRKTVRVLARVRASLRHVNAGVSALAVSVFPLPPALPSGGSYVPMGEAMYIQGQPISAWMLDVPGPVPQVAAWLTARQPALRDMWVMPGSAVLAGMAGSVQWAARLFEAQGRTRGTISALSMAKDSALFVASDSTLSVMNKSTQSVLNDATMSVANGSTLLMANGVGSSSSVTGPATANPGVRRNTASADASWTLKGGQLRFEVRMRDEGATVIEQIWTHDAVPADLGKRLAGDLKAQGWRPAAFDDALSVRMGSHWSRGHMNLSVVIVPLDHGSGLTAVLRIGS